MTMSSETQTLTTTLNQRITVFTHDHIGDKIAKTGLYEKENLELINNILKSMKDAVVLDIGANIGNHSLAFSTQAQAVYAFEPLPEVFSVLSQNIAQNDLTNVFANNLALSDTNDEDDIYMVLEGNVGASSFDKREAEHNVAKVKVSKRIGDELVAELGINKIDMIKIDVEAHEVFVLQGLKNSIEKFKPYIVMEWNDPLTIERLNKSKLLEELFKIYDVYVLGSNYDRAYWERSHFAFIRRKLTRLFKARTARLYPFDPGKLYKNLLLVPKGKDKYLPR